MKLGKVVKTAIKLAPIVYPIVRKVMEEKKVSKKTVSRK
ncbi:hypothetical protein ACFPRA_23945 [Sporosarcina soli]|mgnify:CR=1 FL=1|jgi:hypothetical protein|uniref:Uncharacterized protein n=1 Tax=Sporosarcina soli TaxID=334736 RepID=A0ABW0TQZ3_9BACL